MFKTISTLYRIGIKLLGNMLLCAMLFAITLVGWCHDDTWFRPCTNDALIKFKSGFDESLHIIQTENGKLADLHADNYIQCNLSNKYISKSNPSFGKLNIQFDGGSNFDRVAEIVSDPDNSDNKVLSFWIANPNVIGPKGNAVKGRIQMNLYDNSGLRHVKMSVKLYLHPDLKQLQYYSDKIDWLTISEWWNNAAWTHEKFPFRISLNIFKESSLTPMPLNFQIHAQTLNVENNRWNNIVWQQINRDYSIPFGKWILLEYEFIEGNKTHGRFILHATPEGEKRITIFDIHDYTYHPEDPSPDGLSHFNPIKVYTSEKVINYINSKSGRFEFFWDDLSLDASAKLTE